MVAVKKPVASPAMFRGILGELSGVFHGWAEAPRVSIFANLLVLSSIAVGTKPKVFTVKDERLCIQAITCNATGEEGQKGTSTEMALRLFKEALPDFVKNHVHAGLPNSGPAFVKTIAGYATTPGNIEEWTYGADFVGEDSDEQDRKTRRERVLPGFPVAVFDSEYARSLDTSARDKQFATALRDIWDGKDIKCLADGGNGFLTVPEPHIGLMGHISPGEWLGIQKPELLLPGARGRANLSGGNGNRLFLFWAQVEEDDIIDLPEPMPEGYLTEYAEKLRERIEWAQSFEGTVPFTPEAAEHWKKEVAPWLRGNVRGKPVMNEFAGRARPYARRLGALLALLEGKTAVDIDVLETVTAIMDYVFKSIRYIISMHPKFGEILADEERAAESVVEINGDASKAHPRVIEVFRKKLMESADGISQSDGTRAIKSIDGGKTAQDLEHAAAALEDCVVKVRLPRQPGQMGPPSYRYRWVCQRDGELVDETPAPAAVNGAETPANGRAVANPPTTTPKPPQPLTEALKPAPVRKAPEPARRKEVQQEDLFGSFSKRRV